MASEKIPISFNDGDIKAVREIAELIGISGVYGDFPKALKFGINLALSCLKNPHKVYSDLEDAELDLFFASQKRLEMRLRLNEKARELEKKAEKV